jgi:hypothetical protein
MNRTELLQKREKDKAELLKLFAKHGNQLTHLQCLTAGILDPRAVSFDLCSQGRGVRATIAQSMFMGPDGNPAEFLTESVYELTS